jgi:paraquat-inducible protein A
MEEVVACGTCGLLQRMEPPPKGTRLKCARCRFELRLRKPDSRVRTLTLALAALILYFPANLLPSSKPIIGHAIQAIR